jgi:hypothetical protein
MNPRPTRFLHQLLTLLALVAQLAIGAIVPPMPVLAATADGVPICHGGQQPVDAPSPMHPADCLLCPICVALAGPAVLLPASGPALPTPRIRVFALAAPPPPATAPPAARRGAAQPRAPPAQT